MAQRKGPGTQALGINNFSLIYTTGKLNLDSDSSTVDAVTARAADRFNKVGLSWLRLQPLSNAFSLYFSGTGQFASKNLDSSQKVSLGGAYGVRAYPQGEASGDEGYCVTVETQYNMPAPFPGLWQVSAFIDHSYVGLNKNPWIAANNSRNLTGAGFGLNLIQTNNWYVKSSIAWKAGSEKPTSDTDRSARIWLQAVKYF